jgi:hypothetical protein
MRTMAFRVLNRLLVCLSFRPTIEFLFQVAAVLHAKLQRMYGMHGSN